MCSLFSKPGVNFGGYKMQSNIGTEPVDPYRTSVDCTIYYAGYFIVIDPCGKTTGSKSPDPLPLGTAWQLQTMSCKPSEHFDKASCKACPVRRAIGYSDKM